MFVLVDKCSIVVFLSSLSVLFFLCCFCVCVGGGGGGGGGGSTKVSNDIYLGHLAGKPDTRL